MASEPGAAPPEPEPPEHGRDDGGPSATPRAGLRTTVAVALADPTLLAASRAAVENAADLELVGTPTSTDDALALARRDLPDVLIVGADLVSAEAAAATVDGHPESSSETATGQANEGADSPVQDRAGEDRGATRRGAPAYDLADPVARGLRELCTAVSDEVPAVRIVVVAPEGANSFGAVLGGALGCLPPDRLARQIADAVRRVAWGEGLLTTEWAQAVLGDLGNRATDRKESGPLGRPALTRTELEVLRRTATGATAREIATHHEVPTRDVNRNAASALVKVHRLHADQAVAGPAPDDAPEAGEPAPPAPAPPPADDKPPGPLLFGPRPSEPASEPRQEPEPTAGAPTSPADDPGSASAPLPSRVSRTAALPGRKGPDRNS